MTTYTLIKERDAHGILSVPATYYEALQAEGTIPKQLTFGTRIVKMTIQPLPSLKNECILSEDVWEKLCLPFQAKVRLYVKDDILHIGPLIGIFTAGFVNHELRPIGERSLMFAQYLTAAAKMGGYFFLFGSHVIDWNKSTISGFFYTRNGWTQHEIPFPHVVYDRIPNRKVEQLPQLQGIKKRMETNYFIPWFNSGFFNKWTIYQRLHQDEVALRYIPETIINPSLEQMEAMLAKYQHIYVKPANGSFGNGIIHVIKRRTNNQYYCRFQQNKITLLKRYPQLKQLYDEHLRNRGHEQLIAQQGIALMKVNHRPVDFRVHTNKNLSGEWEVSAIAAKISGYNRVTTHLAKGGKVITIRELLQENDSFRPLIKKLKQTTLYLSKVLEEKMDGFNGELGFDMGIDHRGNLWMFEANSKPGRAIFSHPKLKKAKVATKKLPFEYGTYLTERLLTQPEKMLQ